MMSSFFLHMQPHLSRITGFPVHWTHASLRYAGLPFGGAPAGMISGYGSPSRLLFLCGTIPDVHEQTLPDI